MIADHLRDFFLQTSIYPSPSEQWLWMRVHKTAGTSIYNALEGRCLNTVKNKPFEARKWIKNITEQKLDAYQKWTFVRNPYDRLVSTAAMFYMTPQSFISKFDRLSNMAKRHALPQHLFTHIGGKCWLDFVGKFENLDGDWKQLFPDIPLLQSNATDHEHYLDVLGVKERNWIEEKYSKDLEYFEYEW